MPGFNFYDLKHRHHLDGHSSTVRNSVSTDQPSPPVVGHQDAGATIAQHYLRLDHRRAIERALQAKTVFDCQA